MRITTRERAIAGALVVVAALGAVGLLVLRSQIDHLGDRTDRALSSVRDLRVRVDGLDGLKLQVDDTLAQVRVLAGSVTAGVTANVTGLREAVDHLGAILAGVPALAAQAAEAASAQAAALLDTVRGLVADLGRSLAPMGSLADRLGQPVNVDVHVVQPLIDDLLNLVPTLLAGLT